MQNRKRTSFQAVRDMVQGRIENGTWPQGTLLPTETELAEEFGCARATVNRALRELADGGYVERRRKSGTRVIITPIKQARFTIAPARHEIEEQNARYRYALVQRDICPPPDWLVSRLGLAPDHNVLHLRCMHYADNRPFQFEERWINLTAVPAIALADLSNITPNEWLLSNVPFTTAEIAISAIPADERLAQFLATSQGASVMQTERSIWLRDVPITLVRLAHHPGYEMRARH